MNTTVIATSARPLRVLQLYSRDIVGGVQVLGRMIEEELTASGVAVDNLALASEGSLPRRLLHLGKVAGTILTGRYDAIFAHHAGASVVMGLLGSIVGTRVRAAHLSSMPDEITRRWRPLDRLVGSLGGYTHIIANSATTSAAFSSYPKGFARRIRTIGYGVPAVAPARTVDWRARLGLETGTRLLITASRLTAQKDLATAVRALASLDGMHLAIAGDGPEREHLAALATELDVAGRLHLVGTLTRAELGDFLAAGDLYVFPSVWETFGLSGAEALIAGLPVVAADLTVLREVLAFPGSVAGMVRFHAPRSAAALASEVRAIIADYPDHPTRRQAAVRAQDHHAIASMGRKYLDLIGA